MSNTPALPRVLDAAVSNRIRALHVAMPAKVLSYDSSTQKISAQPLIQRGYRDESGERQTEDLPVINNVPVCFPGAGAISITWPIAAGDTVLLVFSDFSLDRWLERGGVVDPGDDRAHTLTDAIAIPGLRDFAHPADGVHATALVIDAPLIHAGGTSSLAKVSELNNLENRVRILEGEPLASPYAGTTVLKGS